MIYLKKIVLIIRFLFYYLKEIILANLKVAYDILTPRHRMRPGILQIPIRTCSDRELLVLVNLLTMTPGTLVIDVAPDRRSVFIHAMYAGNPEILRDELEKGLITRVREIFQ